MSVGCQITDATHRGHFSTDYVLIWLGRRAELGPLGEAVGCRAYKPSS